MWTDPTSLLHILSWAGAKAGDGLVEVHGGHPNYGVPEDQVCSGQGGWDTASPFATEMGLWTEITRQLQPAVCVD